MLLLFSPPDGVFGSQSWEKNSLDGSTVLVTLPEGGSGVPAPSPDFVRK